MLSQGASGRGLIHPGAVRSARPPIPHPRRRPAFPPAHARGELAGPQAGLRDALGQGLDQPDMPGRDDAAHPLGQLLVVHHPRQVVAPDRLARQRRAPSSSTPRSTLIRTRCGAACSCGCTPMLAASTRSRRKTWRSARALLAIGGASMRVTPRAAGRGGRATIAGAGRRRAPASARSSPAGQGWRARRGRSPRGWCRGAAGPRRTAGRTAAGVCRGLGRAGPGPMPFTRMRGASASAIDWVSAQSPALDTV